MTSSCIGQACLGVVLSLALASVAADPVTERDVVVHALDNNADIRVRRLDVRTDSLSLEAVESGWLPQLDLQAAEEYEPVDTSSQGARNSPSLTSSGSATVTQAIPGGGTATAGVEAGRASMTNGDSVTYAKGLTLALNQPLLKDAWRHGALDYQVRIQRLDHKQFTLQQRKAILSRVSEVRTLFWDCYEKEILCAVLAAQKDYTEKLAQSVRERYRLGEVPPIDTLSSLLEYLTASQRLIEADGARDVARQKLSVALMDESRATIADTSVPVQIGELPAPEEFVRMAEDFDPQLRIFEILAEKLEEDYGHSRNQLLPRLDLGASYSRSASGDAPASASAAFSANAVISLIAQYSFPTKPRRIAVEKAQLEQDKNRISTEQYRKQLVQQVDELVRLWEQERKTLAIAEASRDIARKQFDAADAGYRLGTLDRLSLVKAENDYRDASVRLVQKQIVMKKLEIAFEEITGAVFTRFGVDLE